MPDAEVDATETTVEEVTAVEGGRAMPQVDMWVSLADPTACIRMALIYPPSASNDRDEALDIEVPEHWEFGGSAITHQSCSEAQFSRPDQTESAYYRATSSSGRITENEDGFVLDLVMTFAPDDAVLPERIELVSQQVDY